MRAHLALLLVALPFTTVAQNIGINVTGVSPNASAMLDIDVSGITGTKRGLLIPRMTTAERDAIVTPAISLLIFNTSTVQFEYFDGLVWRGLLSAASAGWGLSGNTGTDPTTNFIGTTDNQALSFKVNGQPAGQLGTGLGGVTSFGHLAGQAGSSNTFIGNQSGIGTTGQGNTMVGWSAGLFNTTGTGNTFVGTSAGEAGNGSSNTMIGSSAGMLSGPFSNSSAIGANAKVTQNNCMVLGSIAGVAGATTSVNVGIGTTAPSTPLHVRRVPATNNINPTVIIENGQLGSASNITFLNSITTNSTSMGMLANGDFGIHQGCNFGGCIIGTEALRIKPNGNVGLGTTNALERLHVVGRIRMADGNQALGRVLVSDANGTGSWVDPLAVASGLTWTLTGNAGTNPAINFMGTTDNAAMRFRTNNVPRVQITSAGRLEVGVAAVLPFFSTGAAKLLVASELTGEDNATVWAAHNTPSGRASLSLARQRGSFSTFNPVIDGDGIGEVVFEGYGGSTHLSAASIFSDADGSPGLTSVPGKLGFATTPFGSTTPVERMTIRSNGNIGIGTVAPQTALDVLGALALRDDGTVTNVIADNQLVIVGNRGFIRLTSTNNLASARTITLSDGLVRGQLLMIQATPSLNVFEVDDNLATNNTVVPVTRILGVNDTIMLLWNGSDWIELSYSDN